MGVRGCRFSRIQDKEEQQILAFARGSLPLCRHFVTYLSSTSELTIWHSLGELVSFPEVWLAQCLCESKESLPYRRLVEAAKAEEQRFWIGTFQSTSIDGENLNILRRGQLFSSS